jgi:RNA polymerase sigma-70 factor (ECF subfamily)
MNAVPTTHWSVVLNVGCGTSETAARALERLCQTYWYPVYALTRALGDSPEDAADLTQEFFAFVLRDVARTADPSKGRFRSWLKGSFKRFRTHRRRYTQALKRGGQAQIVSFDAMEAEQRYTLEPRTELSPDVIFDRNWLVACLDTALERLRGLFAAEQKEHLFDLLKDHLQRAEENTPYLQLAESLGTSEAAIKMQVLRLRRRYAQMLLAVVGDTLADPSRAREELQELQQVMKTT